MDKEKIKAAVSEAKVIMDELVAEGKLDGDQAKKMLFEFTARAIEREFIKSLEVV